MLLKPQNAQSPSSRLKHKYFAFEQCLVNSKDEFTSLITFLLEMIYFLPTVSVLFKDNTFGEAYINTCILLFIFLVFSFFQWQNFHTHFDVNELLTLCLMTLWFFAFMVAIIYSYNLQKPNSFSSRMAVNFLSVIAYFNVPYTGLHLNVMLKNYNDESFHIFFKLIAAISLVISITLTLLFLKLKMKPLRKGNSNWSVTNEYEFNRFCLNFLRTIIFTIDGVHAINLVVSAALEYLLRLVPMKYYSKAYLQEVETSSNLIIATHLGFIIDTLSNDNSMIAQKFLFVSWLILAFKGIYGWYHEETKPLEFPLCTSSPYEFYDFYYRLSAKYDQKVPNQYQSNQEFYFSTMKQHSRRCKSKGCPLDGVCLMKKNIVSQVQGFISEILRKTKEADYSPDLQILEELWKFQGGKKFSFRAKSYDIDLQAQYKIYIVENSDPEKGQEILQENSNENSSKLLSGIFIDQLMVILQNFSQFYGEILKAKPKIEIIANYGERMRVRGEEIQIMYLDLLKKKAISFKAIEIYLEFEIYFLKVNSLSDELLKKIISIQKNIESDDIQQIYLPAVTVYSESGQIQDANMQTVSFLKYNRFELKTKLVKEIILPVFRYQSYFQLSDQDIQNSLMFVMKKHGEFSCVRIKISTKFLNNKKFYVFTFEKKKKTEGTNYILVENQNFQIVNLVTDVEIYKDKRHPEVMTTVNWKEIFYSHIKKVKKELLITKLMKIDIKEYNSFLMCSLNKTFNQNFSILNLKLMRNIKESINDRRSIVKRDSQNFAQSLTKFNFIYDLNNEVLTKIRGYRKDVNAVREEVRRATTIGMNPFALQMRGSVVDFALLKNKNYKEGIKTYRLHEQDLYNIDLQDKDAYVEEFDGLRNTTYGGERELKKPVDIYVIALVVAVSLILAAMSVFIFYTMNVNMKNVSSDFMVSSEIDRFKINFYRIAAMFRDVALEIYDQVGRDWVTDIMQSYNLIKQNENKKMFSNDQVTINYQERVYKGNLNQLVEVIFSEVYMITKTNELQVIEDFHNTIILELTDMIEGQQDQVSARILNNLQQMKSLKNYIGMGVIVGIIIFYLLMIFLCYNLVATVKYNLHNLMLTSDHEARYSQENAEKILYAIDMIKKNFEVDVRNLVLEKKSFRKRRREKETVVGYDLKLIVFTVIMMFFILNIMVILMFNIIIESNFNSFLKMKSQGENILAIYSDLCKETNYIDHTGIINKENIAKLQLELIEFEKSVTELTFSDETNSIIKEYFLEDSCNRLDDNRYFEGETMLTCIRAFPDYEIQSPFSIGLHLYLNRIHYYLVENISEAYACTGIYSSQVSKVFSELSRRISKDVEAKLQKFIFDASLYSFFLIAINILYCISAVLLSLYIKRKNESVEKFIKFLNLKNGKENTKKTKKQIVAQKQSQRTIEVERRHPKRLSMLETE